MRPITLTAMVGVITLALGGAAWAHGGGGGGFHGGGGGGFQGGGGFRGGGGGFHASAFHGGGFHGDRGGFHGDRGGSHRGEMHASTHSHDSSGHQSAMNDRSNRGGLRRGAERASYVHGLNSERRGTSGAGEHTGTTATTGTSTTRTGGI
jgi:hypothetical protein